MKRAFSILAVLLALCLLAVPASACNGVQLLSSNVCVQPAFVQYVQPFVSTVQFAVVQPQIVVQPAYVQQAVAVQPAFVQSVAVQQNVVAARVRQRVRVRAFVPLRARQVIRQRTVIRR